MNQRPQKYFSKVSLALLLGIGVFFLIWVVFFDEYNYKAQFEFQSKIDKLEEEKIYYLQQIKKDSTRINELNTNNDNLEKFAREKFFMKKEHEDVYIIVEEDE